MRYAVFTDIHANLEALEAVLARVDELAKEEPIDQIWFLGDLVGYGPNPNECITTLRERTNVIIAGNHDWAAVGKLDLEDFSTAARVSAEWTAKQLTQEHHEFLASLPERLNIGECTLVHGSPYGPLWEYLTSEVLAERSFQHFHTRYCFVGHTHVPLIFQQPYTFATMPTGPLKNSEKDEAISLEPQDVLANIDEIEAQDEFNEADSDVDEEETKKTVAIRPNLQNTMINVTTTPTDNVLKEPENTQAVITEITIVASDTSFNNGNKEQTEAAPTIENVEESKQEHSTSSTSDEVVDEHLTADARETLSSGSSPSNEEDGTEADESHDDAPDNAEAKDDEETPQDAEEEPLEDVREAVSENIETSSEETIVSAEDRLNSEIEELLTLLGLSQSMIKVTNEMLMPPEGEWFTPENYRAIINPGGVGQPRDGDPRAAFMIYDTERGFTFYRVPYNYENTQEKIIKAGLPPYLAARLAYGR